MDRSESAGEAGGQAQPLGKAFSVSEACIQLGQTPTKITVYKDWVDSAVSVLGCRHSIHSDP